jgi:hypothetical protein
MQNFVKKAQAGRRKALMLRSIHLTVRAPAVPEVRIYGSAAPALPQQGFVQRVALSEDRVSKLASL